MRGKITKRAVDAMKPAKREVFLWDTELRGFGVRLMPSGIRAYVFQYKRDGHPRRLTIGKHGDPETPETARAEALRLKREVAKGHDPAEERKEANKAPTVDEFADRYLVEYAEPRKKPSSITEDKRLLDRHIRPAFGRRKLAAVTRADVARLHAGLSETPYVANRVRALLSRMMSLAEKWGVRPDGVNPCKHVEKFKEQGRERFLTPEELVRIGQAIAEAERSGSEPLAALAALRMLFLTGMRRGEVLSLRWPEVDLERGVLTLPDSKTGAKVVRIGAPAVELLSGLPREAKNPHVFPGRKEGSAFVGLPWVWYRLREKAKLPDVRIHDARHSFASVAASGGSSLLIIGALLGHKRAATTQKYTHLQDDPVRAVADSTSRTIADALAGKVPEPEPAPGKVVSINSPRKRRAKR